MEEKGLCNLTWLWCPLPPWAGQGGPEDITVPIGDVQGKLPVTYRAVLPAGETSAI